ncbi:MAG: protein kinase [bacterium]
MQPRDFPDGYIPRRELGEGSMGTVWLAQSERYGGHCAIKVLNLRNDRRGSAERSFNREVRAMARLDHPSIVAVHDYGRTPEGSPFMAMEFVDGHPLTRYVRGPWSFARLWTLVDELLAALGHAHARELVHRDLKPGNILIRPERPGPGAIKVVDFGIALAVSDAMRATRRIEGTPAYIAPEAASGNVAAVGPWTDIYSLGIILFEILTGDLPYHGRHLLAHHQRSPLPPITVRDDVEAPPGIAAIVTQMLHKSPLDRFRSIAGVRAAFEALGPLPAPVRFGPPPGELLYDEVEREDVALMTGPAGPALAHLREPALVGREAAQRDLLAAADAALLGKGPQVVVIEGDAGLGKSRLAGWMRELMEEHGRMRTLVVRSEPQTRSGGGLRQSVLRFVGAPGIDRDEAERTLAAVFRDDEERRAALEVLWSQAPHEGAASEAHIRRAAELIRKLAGDAPFLFWADDAQWSPEGKVLRLVHRLARPDGPKRLLLIVTLRPSDRSTVQAARKAILRLDNTTHIELAPLNPMVLAPALEQLARIDPDIAIGASMLGAGNPLIALEAVRAHIEAEGFGSAPSDPNTVLRQRIERATEGERGGEMVSMLARATLLGRSFTLRPLEALCKVPGDPAAPGLGEDTEQIEDLLDRAVQSGLAVEQGPGRWRFSHDLVRAQLRKVCRALPNWGPINLAAARLRARRAESDPTGIEMEVVARHYWAGGEKERALRMGVDGAHRLHDAGLMGHAVSFTRRLLEWAEAVEILSPAEVCELHLLASDAAEHAGQPIESERQAQSAVDIARRHHLDALGARAAGRLGVLKLQHDDQDEAEQWLWDALRFARDSGDRRALADVHHSLGRFYQHKGEHELALVAFEFSLESAIESGIVAQQIAARSALARLDRIQGRVDRAEQCFEKLAEQALEEGLEVAAVDARLQLGLCAWTRDDAPAALAAFEEARQSARGNLFVLEFVACLGEAWAHAVEGAWNDADLILMQAEDLRYDVRHRDPETERLRRDIRTLAVAARRDDLVERIDKLHTASTRTGGGSTQHTR